MEKQTEMKENIVQKVSISEISLWRLDGYT